MTPYSVTPDCNVSPVLLMGSMIALLAASLMKKNIVLRSNIERLEDEIEMAHMHQEVLERDIGCLEHALAHKHKQDQPHDLESEIIGILSQNKKGMLSKDVHKIIVSYMPLVTKKDVNSMLYTMDNKKLVNKKTSRSSSAPLWGAA